jgi:hypothetical protein
MARSTGQDSTNGSEATATKGKYTVLEAIDATVPATDEGGEAQTVRAFVPKGEVTARSKNDAIRTAFNEGVIEGAGEYAAVTTRSFAPIKVEPKTRTALSWG